MCKLICVKCQHEMKPERNGVYYLEYASFGPYKLWHSDKWKCSECRQEVLTGFGYSPIREHFEKDFQEFVNDIRTDPDKELIEENTSV